MWRAIVALTLAASVALLQPACGKREEGQSTAAILGASAAGVDGAFSAAGKYRNFGGTGEAPCSAVAVAPNLALTAAHCVDTKVNTCTAFFANAGGMTANDLPELEFRADGRFDQGGSHYTIDGIIVAPGAFYRDARLCPPSSKGSCANQLADPISAFSGRPSRDIAIVHFSTSGKPTLKEIGVTPLPVVTDITDPKANTFTHPLARHLDLDLAQFRTSQGPPPFVRIVGCGVNAANDVNRHAGFAPVLRDLKWPVFLWDNQPKDANGNTLPPDCDANHVQGERIPTLRLATQDGVEYGGGDSGGAIVVSGGAQNVPSGVPSGDYLLGLATVQTNINGLNVIEMAATLLACPIKDPANLPELKACAELRDWLESRLLDFDGDGVRETEPDGSPGADNCPITYNPTQSNCNRDSEIAYKNRPPINRPKAPLLGDSCDPVPCPQSNADSITAETGAGGGNVPVCGQDQLGETCAGRRIHDEPELRPIGASWVGAYSSAPGQISRHPVLVDNTAPRFCQSNPAKLYRCNDPLVLQDDRREDGRQPQDEIKNDPLFPYHRVTLRPGACTLFSKLFGCVSWSFQAPLPRGAPLTGLTYEAIGPRRFKWEYAQDLSFWQSNNLLPQPYHDSSKYPECTDTGTFGAGTCLGGMFWLNADATTGISNSFTPIVNGGILVDRHPPSDSQADRYFANHYFPLRPDSAEAWRRLFKVAIVAPFPLYRIDLPEPDPPWLLAQVGRALVLSVENGQVLAETDTGASYAAATLVGPAMLAVSGQVVWLDGEPNATTAAALSLDGTTLRYLARTNPLRLAQPFSLIARKTYAPAKWEDASTSFTAPVRFVLPAAIPVTEGNSGNHWLTLEYREPGGATHGCRYRGGSKKAHPDDPAERYAAREYVFDSCTSAAIPGAELATDSLLVHVQNGDSKEPATSVRLDLLLTEAGTAFTVPPPPSTTSPPPRTGFFGAYSAAARRVFVAGGADASGPRSDVWTRSFDEAWRPMPAELGTILGVAYAYRVQRLFVLHRTSTRLVLTALSPFGAEERTVLTWPLPASYDRFFVHVDFDGNVVIAGSSSSALRFAVIDPDAAPISVLATDEGEGRLLRPPIFDQHGVAIVYETAAAGRAYARLPRLEVAPANGTVFP